MNSVEKTYTTGNDKSKQITVETPQVGTYQGYRDQNSFRFLGIPYAQAPIGNLQFVAPKPWTLANWKNTSNYNNSNSKSNASSSSSSTTMDATEFGNACYQIEYSGARTKKRTQAVFVLGANQFEDCLYLNVFTPTLKAPKGLPVMVYGQ